MVQGDARKSFLDVVEMLPMWKCCQFQCCQWPMGRARGMLFSHKERKGHKGGKWNGSGAERSCVLLARQRLKVVLLEVLDSAEESIFRFRD